MKNRPKLENGLKDKNGLLWRKLHEYETKLITDAVHDFGTMSDTADHLGINIDTLKDHCKRLGIDTSKLLKEARAIAKVFYEKARLAKYDQETAILPVAGAVTAPSAGAAPRAWAPLPTPLARIEVAAPIERPPTHPTGVECPQCGETVETLVHTPGTDGEKEVDLGCEACAERNTEGGFDADGGEEPREIVFDEDPDEFPEEVTE